MACVLVDKTRESGERYLTAPSICPSFRVVHRELVIQGVFVGARKTLSYLEVVSSSG